MRYRGSIKQDGCVVARAEGDLGQVWVEIGHYISMYLNDGPIEKVEIKRVKTKGE